MKFTLSSAQLGQHRQIWEFLALPMGSSPSSTQHPKKPTLLPRALPTHHRGIRNISHKSSLTCLSCQDKPELHIMQKFLMR